MSDRNTVKDWEEYQQNQIDAAQEDIQDRRDHLGDYRQEGLLDGEFVNDLDNQAFKSYLQGYADALEYAAERTDRIDNMASYAFESGRTETPDSDVSMWVWQSEDGGWKLTISTEEREQAYYFPLNDNSWDHDVEPLEAADNYTTFVPGNDRNAQSNGGRDE